MKRCPVNCFETHNKLFSFNGRMVLDWSSQNQVFSTEGSCSKKYWFWYFKIIVIIGVIGFGSCVVVIKNHQEEGTQMSVLALLFGLHSMYVWLSVPILTCFAKELATSFNSANKFLLKFEKVATNLEPLAKPNKSPDWELIHRILAFNMLILFYLPFVLTPLGIFFNLDPFHYSLPKFFSVLQHGDCVISRLIYFALRSILSMACVTEACRYLGFLICLCLPFWMEMVLKILKLLDAGMKHGKWDHFSLNYAILQFLHQSILKPVNLVVGIFMGVGLSCFVVCNIATMKAFNILPLPIYCLMPILSLVKASVFAIIITVLVMSHEISKRILQQGAGVLRTKYGRFRRKLMLRRLQAFKPITFSCAGSFKLVKGEDLTYFSHVVYRTVDIGIMLQ